nr:hypothetical protein [Tanacetum cinerariifolium]
MNLYHSRLTQDDLNDLIIKYKIPRDLYPRLPSEEFMMSELLDDAIGIYHWMFDFSSVRIPFSSFLLALIKHYRVHFSQLSPLGVNKVITFEVLTMTLFRVFQTLCKQGDWFSFAKRSAPSLYADVRRLSAHVIKLRDMPEGVRVLSGLSRVWKSRVCDPVLWGADGNVTGIHDFLCLPQWTSAEVQEESHLDLGRPFRGFPFTVLLLLWPMLLFWIQLRRISMWVPLVLRFLLRMKLPRSERPLVLVPPRAMFLSAPGNQARRSTAPANKDPNTRGKGIMADDAAAPSVGVSRPRPSSSPVPLFMDVSDMLFMRISSLFLLVNIMPPILKMALLGTASLLARSGMIPDSRLKGYEEKVAGAAGLKLQVSTLKKKVSRLNDKIASSDASFAKSKAKGKDKKKKIKLAEASFLVARTDYAFLNKIFEHATEPLLVILQLEPEKLARPANVPPSRDARVSPPTTKELTVTPSYTSLELSINGISVALEDAVEFVEVWLGHASSDHNDVGVSLSVGEKGDGLVPSYAAAEEAATNSSSV